MRRTSFFNLALAAGLAITATACERDTTRRADREVDDATRSVDQSSQRLVQGGKETARDAKGDTESAARDIVQGTRELGEDIDEGARDVGRAINEEAREITSNAQRSDAEQSAMLSPAEDPWNNTLPSSTPLGVTPSTGEGSAGDYSSQPSIMGQAEPETQEPAQQT
ncbi:MAG: hypothetical protein SFX73_24240, partial [Kofleriaceae bacterium]|nr:hypothetical protein [Kofleriaceae bacterium]